MVLVLLSFVLSYVIGVLGRNRKLGFWGHFFASLFLTPLIGILLVVATDPVRNDGEKKSKATYRRVEDGKSEIIKSGD
jgi:hypothetical protein